MDKIDFEKYAESIPKPEIRTDTQPQQDVEVDDVWKIVTENLRMVLDRVEYDSWFAGTHLERVQNGDSYFFWLNLILFEFCKYNFD